MPVNGKSRRSYRGAPVSNTLGVTLAEAATNITLAVAMSGWSTDAEPFFVVVDPGTAKEEKICVKYSSATTLTVVDPAATSTWGASASGRGADGTTDRQHEQGAVIYPVFTALEANHANELVSKYANAGSVVYQGSGTPGTFTELAIGTASHVLRVNSGVPQWGQISADGIATGAVTGAKLANGYTYVTTIYFTSTGTFSKASYAYLRAIRVKVQGAGGGGGGTGFGYFHGGGGGGGGGYAESFITDISGLASSVTVTVPTAPTSGSGGGSASFGTAVVATGGAGGGYAELDNVGGGSGGIGTAGDILIAGSGGGTGFGGTGGVAISGAGGSSMLGGGGSGSVTYSSGGIVSEAGRNYGGGGGGVAVGSATSAAGSTGSQGIVIVELYA